MTQPDRGAPAPSTPPLSSDPWRLFFPLGFVAGVVALVLWWLSLRGAGLLQPQHHGALMIWGGFGSVVLGFFLTAFHRQNGASAPPGALVWAAALGQVVFLVGFPMPGAMGAAGWVAGCLTWALVLGYALPIAVRSLWRSWESTTATIPLALVASLVGMVLLRSYPSLGLEVGLTGFLLLLALALLDRLLPFFSSKRIRGYTGERLDGFLPGIATILLLHPLLELHPVPRVVGGLTLAALLLRQMVGWRADQGLTVPLVAVLHLGVLWIAVGGVVEAFGLEPRHYWSVGGMGTLVMSFAVRVTRGHSGLELRLGPLGAVAIALVQLAALFRVLGDGLWFQAAALCLAVAMGIWLMHLGPRCIPER